ncbi:MAG: hypothetical protein IJ042_01160 [Butyricicoccus sp.]|nr:hypothetical protein [Butyricicoccus sp.]
MLQFYQITMFILPFVCLYFHITKDKKRIKMSLSCVQTISACNAIQTLTRLYRVSGGADRGMEFLQLQLPLVIYWIFAISGIVFCVYYEKYKDT